MSREREEVSKLNWGLIHKYVEDGLVKKTKHPCYDLYIYKYGQQVQYMNEWTPELEWCRGLVTDGDDNVIAIPFKKFFNWQEIPEIMKERAGQPFKVYEKLDGSLGIFFYYKEEDTWIMATRGSFTSEQSAKGMEIMKEKYGGALELGHFNKAYTYLFEIIYPTNRIVVTYDETELYQLDAVQAQEDFPQLTYASIEAMPPLVKEFKDLTNIQEMTEDETKNFEGYIIQYADGYRVKVKLDEYVRLHRIVSGLNTRTIWEWLKNKDDYKANLEGIPDELYDWIKKTVDSFWEKHKEISTNSRAEFLVNEHLLNESRKDFALAIKDSKYKGLLFMWADGKDNDQVFTKVWDMLKPDGTHFYMEEA